nr:MULTISPECIES: glutathione S-transferase family protein [unclassified Caballeronia]
MNAPPLTLISHPICPFVQRAAIVLGEKGTAFTRIDVDLADKPDWFLALSPTGKVPVLCVRPHDGADAVLFESMAICEYLDEAVDGPRLHPANALARAEHRAWIEFASALLTDAWRLLNAGNQETAQSAGAAFAQKLQRFDAQLREGPYFAGPAFSMVDAVVAPVYRYFDVLDGSDAERWFDGLERVRTWRSALAQRPSVQAAVVSDYGERFRAHLDRCHALLACGRES